MICEWFQKTISCNFLASINPHSASIICNTVWYKTSVRRSINERNVYDKYNSVTAQDLYIHLLNNTKTYLCYALRIAGNIARAYTFKVNNKNTDVLNLVRDHPFSTYAKCSEKIFLTPRYVSYLCVSGG